MITDGAMRATFIWFGQYTAAGFHLAADGGGTAVTYAMSAHTHGDLTAGHG